MENKQFEILLERIRIGSYPPTLGYNITVDQFLKIQDMCGNLVTQVPPGDNEELMLITEYLLSWKIKVNDPFTLEKRLAESLKGKIGLFESIEKLIDAYQSDDTKDSILLIHGDNANQKAQFKIYGSPQSAAMAFAALLDNDKSELKRFIFSIIGTYLAKNPEDHKMFMRGIEEVKKHAPGIN